MSDGLNDILSLALEQTGVGALPTPHVSVENPTMILSAAAGTIDNAVLASDIGELTEGLFSSLHGVKPPVAVPSTTAYGTMSPQRGVTNGSTVPHSINRSGFVRPFPPPPMDCGLNAHSMSGSHAEPLPDLGDLDDLLPNVGAAAVPVQNTEISIPNAFGSMSFQSSNQNPATNTALSFDDELSDLLNDTGSEYFENFTRQFDNTATHHLYPPPPDPFTSNTSTTFGTPVARNLLNPAASFPNAAALITSSSSAPMYDVNAVIDQVSQPAQYQIASSPAATFHGKTAGLSPVVIPKHGTTLNSGRDWSRVQIIATAAETKQQQQQQQQPAGEDSDDEDEQFTAADTYTNYKPAKLKLGHVHPDSVVESSSLSSVEPPQVWFDLKFPAHVIDEARLSSLQLESVVYACQQHMNILSDGTRAGFLIGDGAGVGKGRTVAGIIFQNYLEGRKKALWLSVSNDLKFDAIRDLRDVGAKKIDVYSLNKFHYGKISGKRNGRVRKGVIFATYSSLIGESSSGGKYRTRFNQLLHWLGPHFEGVIVFDECHKAKNLVPTGSSKPSKTGLTVLQLQKKLPKARIVYCSATGASEPRNMAYMSRLGIWGQGTQFPNFQDFIKAVERRGVGAMEIVAMDMKLRGMYAARQLSFAGVNFDIKDVPLSEKFVEMYDASVELWVEARKLFQEAADLMDFDRKKLKPMWAQFWASHQRFFKYLCIAAKVPEAIQLAKKALEDGKCVVIGLQSTGEARTLEQLGQNDGELTGFISTAKGVLETLVQRHFPTPSSGINWNLFDNDPTLPGSCRRSRKRGGARRGPLFHEDEPFSSESEDTSGSPEGSDSAVESSSEGSEGSSTSEDEESGGESSDEEKGDYNPFGAEGEPWLKQGKPKAKRRKTNHQEKSKQNFSIKPPPSSSGRRGCKTKTGFNSKSLKFEPVNSPNEPKKVPPHLLERRQTVCMSKDIGRLPSFSSQERRPSLQVSMSAVGEGQSILDIMSSSAMASGSQSGLRNVTVRKMKEKLLQKLEVLSSHLPTNTLDELIDGLGGPGKVAEMTGRRGRVVSLPDGSVQYQLRSESDISLELLNITEKQRFMDGKKNIAIISEAASSGISLQSDRRAKNHKRRVHITLELPWSADKAIQQFGRTHRSNQVSAPEYIFLISELSGEQRFASIVAKRLESLGALTHGDRRATESKDLTKFNVDTKYGRQSLELVLKSILGTEKPLVNSEDYPQEFFDECRASLIGVGILTKDERGLLTLEKEATSISRFLNRILGLSVKLQNQLFAYFSDTLGQVIQQAQRMGRWDGGIQDFGAAGEYVEMVDKEEYVGDPAFGTATTQLYKIHVERGMSFSEAVQKLNTDHYPGEGFYLSKRVRNGKQTAVLLKASEPSTNLFSVYRPNTGRQTKPEKLSTLHKKYSKVELAEGEKWWSHQYESSESVCNHAYWQGRCRLSTVGHPCEVGLRRRTYHILAGSVLGVWTHLEGVFVRHSGHNSRMQIARVRMPNKRLVGILIPTACVEDMKQTLSRIALQAAGTSENPLEV